MKEFNINNYIYIQITPDGWRHLHNTCTNDYLNLKLGGSELCINGGIYYKIQCYQAFELLPVNHGKKPLFKMKILINENDLTNLE